MDTDDDEMTVVALSAVTATEAAVVAICTYGVGEPTVANVGCDKSTSSTST